MHRNWYREAGLHANLTWPGSCGSAAMLLKNPPPCRPRLWVVLVHYYGFYLQISILCPRLLELSKTPNPFFSMIYRRFIASERMAINLHTYTQQVGAWLSWDRIPSSLNRNARLSKQIKRSSSELFQHIEVWRRLCDLSGFTLQR